MTTAAASAPTREPDPFTLARPRASWALLPTLGVAGSAFLFFALRIPLPGYALLVASLAAAFVLDAFRPGTRQLVDGAPPRTLGPDLLLIGVGIAIVSTTSVEADVSWPSFVRIGLTLGLAVLVPLLLDRLVYPRFLDRATGAGRRAIAFPIRGHRLSRLELGYIVAVPLLGWAILPFYFIRSGAYLNWPRLEDTGELIRFFVGVNAVGTWDELFFICTCFALLRRHLPMWQANLVQTVIFVSFLWELGYRAWGPLLTIPFALLQGYLFSRTRSFGYVLIVHLLFDGIVFLAIVHAHHPDWLPIFVY
ncbi:MAG: CPBP family intramembrane metalloprotease [Actinomycetales bacterium]|nr:CPBP family intramembrane metalloprotease [Actinomycetales bacterium]